MTFGALQHKATGIFLWARFRSRTDWISKVLSPLSKEVAPALAAFGAGAASGSSAGSGKTRTALFRDPKSGTRYLVVVNHGAVATKAHVKVTTSLKMKKAYSKTDGSWDISDGGFERTFGPYEAQMYRLSG